MTCTQFRTHLHSLQFVSPVTKTDASVEFSNDPAWKKKATDIMMKTSIGASHQFASPPSSLGWGGVRGSRILMGFTSNELQLPAAFQTICCFFFCYTGAFFFFFSVFVSPPTHQKPPCTHRIVRTLGECHRKAMNSTSDFPEPYSSQP